MSEQKKQNNVTGRTFWDVFLSKKFLIVTLCLLILLIILAATGLIELRIGGKNFEFKTRPIEGIRGDPVEIKILSSEISRSIKQVFVPTFTDTLVNSGGSTDGDYLDGISDLFAAKLSSRYETSFVDMDPKREYGFNAVIKDIAKMPHDRSFGVLIGNVHKYQDECPDIGQKAILSITISLFDQDGKRIWIASQTTSAKTKKTTGEPPLGGIEAIELLSRMSTEMVRKLEKKLW